MMVDKRGRDKLKLSKPLCLTHPTSSEHIAPAFDQMQRDWMCVFLSVEEAKWWMFMQVVASRMRWGKTSRGEATKGKQP